MHKFKTSDRENSHFPTLENWNMLVIKSANGAETSPAPLCHYPEISHEAEALMRLAMNGADEQARLAFGISLYGEDFKSVILIAAGGEWWTFKLATGLI